MSSLAPELLQATPLVTAKERSFRLTAKRKAAKGVAILELAPVDGEPLADTQAGEHIGLVLPNGLVRQYSLISGEESPSAYVIAVKRDEASRGGSSFVHDKLTVGDELPVEAPRNNFPLREDAPETLLIAGGIGITPLRAMAVRLAALGRPWRLHYACRSRDEAVFLEDFDGRENVTLHFDDEQGGRFMPIADIVASAGAGVHLYCCGPAPMLSTFEAAVAGRPADTVHVEYFSQKFESATEGGFVVELARSGREVRIPPGQSILHALRAEGLSLISSCEEGICGACETKVLEGEPDHRDAILSDEERANSRTMMICCSGSKSSRLKLDL